MAKAKARSENPHPAREKLPREFYTRQNTLQVARELLGKKLVVASPDGTRVSGIIVETEAYLGPLDRASHAYGNRRSSRTKPMYSVGGTAYVFFVYGMYHQFNVVSNVEGIPHAILIRALEPSEGIDIMRERRSGRKDVQLTNGPGKLCLAMGIDRSLDGADLLGSRVWIETAENLKPRQIAKGPRVGIDYAEEYVTKPWRFWIKDNPHVSRI
jgi:DNA-3-methyladenine glycosylase